MARPDARHVHDAFYLQAEALHQSGRGHSHSSGTTETWMPQPTYAVCLTMVICSLCQMGLALMPAKHCLCLIMMSWPKLNMHSPAITYQVTGLVVLST